MLTIRYSTKTSARVHLCDDLYTLAFPIRFRVMMNFIKKLFIFEYFLLVKFKRIWFFKSLSKSIGNIKICYCIS